MAQTFLTGLASGLSGVSGRSGAAAVQTRMDNQMKFDQRLLGEMQAYEDESGRPLLDMSSGKAKINWDLLLRQENQGLRKRLMNAGGNALSKYFDRRGNVRQGAFDDIFPVNEAGDVSLQIEKDDGTKAPKTLNQSEDPEDPVAVVPRQHLERTGQVIINNILERANPGYGYGLTLQREQLKAEEVRLQKGITDRLAGPEAEYKLFKNKLQTEINELNQALSDTLADEEATPDATSDSMITINEELDKKEGELKVLNEQYEIPASITHRDSKDELSEGVLRRMGQAGMSDEAIQSQISRNTKVLNKLDVLGGRWNSNIKRKQAIGASKNLADLEIVKSNYWSKPSVANVENAPTNAEDYDTLQKKDPTLLNPLEQRRLRIYTKREQDFEEKATRHQSTIDNIVLDAQPRVGENKTKGDIKEKGWTPPTGTAEPWTHEAEETVLQDQIEEEADDSLLMQIRNKEAQLATLDKGWATFKDVLAAPMKDASDVRTRNIIMMQMAKREAQAAGATGAAVFTTAATWLAAYHNIVASGDPDTSLLDLEKHQLDKQKEERARDELLEKIRTTNLQYEKEGILDQVSIMDGILDENANLLPVYGNKQFALAATKALGRWDSMVREKAVKMPDGTWAFDESVPGAGAAQQAAQTVVGMGIMSAAYHKSEDVNPIFPMLFNPRWWNSSWFFSDPYMADAQNLGGVFDKLAPVFIETTGKDGKKYKKLDYVTFVRGGGETDEYLTYGELETLFGDDIHKVMDMLEQKAVYNEYNNIYQDKMKSRELPGAKRRRARSY